MGETGTEKELLSGIAESRILSGLCLQVLHLSVYLCGFACLFKDTDTFRSLFLFNCVEPDTELTAQATLLQANRQN